MSSQSKILFLTNPIKNNPMKLVTNRLNWLSITTGGLAATLLLMSDVRAAEFIPTTSTVSEASSPQLIALARKKKVRKQKAKPKAKRITQPTAIITPTSTDAPYTQAPPPTPPEAPASIPTPPPTVTPNPVIVPAAEAPKAPEPAPAAEAPKAPETNQFSLNTKLQGQVIFGLAGTISGDYSRNSAFGNRTRLELKTDLGGGTLTTRLQAVNLGSATQNPTAGTTAVSTPEGSLSWTDGSTSSTIGVDALKYEYPLSPQTVVVVAANAGAADDFADTINPYFDGDGASGAISSFGNRPSIYYTVQGAGAGIRHQLSDSTELSVGYLARNASNPAVGNGTFGGGYGALAQLTFKTSSNSKVGLTYTRSKNSDPGTGSNNANLLGDSNNFGVQASLQLSPQLALGGWAGYTKNQAVNNGGDREIWNWAVTAAAPDFGGKGNLAGLLVGQEPRVTAATNGTQDSKSGLHIEGFYQIKLNDNLSITPGIIYLTAPDQNASSQGAVIGAIRTTFTF
jgi:Carbohydrate-selective porin, OprB family